MGKRHGFMVDVKDVLRQRTRTKSSGRCCSKFDFCSALKTLAYILLFYTFSISLTFYNQRFIQHFRFPLTITMSHLLTKFVMASIVRSVLFCWTGRARITLSWLEYLKHVGPVGVASSLDIGLSNWSFAFVTVSLYTMTKTTVIVFILGFSILFQLEKLRFSLILVILFIAVGLFLFTFQSTQFHPIGFLLLIIASFLSGLRWTLTQLLLQRNESGLGNPLDMMYHIQPWMILTLLPLSTGFEGLNVAISEFAFGFQNNILLAQTLGLLFAGALLAFMLELCEYALVSHTSGLTLSVAGIFKEVLVLLLAALINGDQMSPLNAVGLVICMMGIVLHVVFKAAYSSEQKAANHDEDLDSSVRQNLLESDWITDNDL